eukprot:UC4_evm1s1128
MDPAFYANLVVKVCSAADQAGANKQQCQLIKERVKQAVSLAQKLLPLKQGISQDVLEHLYALAELLRSAEDLCKQYQGKWYVEKLAFGKKHKNKFDEVNCRLDRSIQIFSLALQIDSSDLERSIRDLQLRTAAAQAQDAKNMEKQLLEITGSIEANADSLANLADSIGDMKKALASLALNTSPLPPPSSIDTKMESWELDKKDFEFDREENDDGDMEKIVLGSGASGTVYLGKCFGTKAVAKEIKKVSPEVETAFRRELEIATKLHHPNIVCCFGGIVLKSSVRIILEHLELSMHQEIHVKKSRFSPNQKLTFMCGAARGVAYLHDVNVAHRDIKPDNLMLDAKQTIKVVDFGLATTKANSHPGITSKTTKSGAMAGTHGYMAPELYHGGGGRKVDVWALGM